MAITGISFSSNLFVKDTKESVRVSEPVTLKSTPQVDTFNGKTLIPTKKSALDTALEFLGKKNKRPKRVGTKYPANQNQANTKPGLNEEEFDMAPGPYGRKGGYRNLFTEQLKATPDITLRSELKKDKTIYNLDRAEKRISSLSRYLKEDMVGYITPAGYHWFESSLENLIYGARAKKVPQNEFKSAAKELWSLIAKADPYWTSQEFLNYLDSMSQNPAVVATSQAIKEIKLEKQGLLQKVSFGYKSRMKEIDKLLEDGCAYTGVPMRRSGDQYYLVSLEHIFPHSKGGNDNDLNYLLATAKSNSERGNMPLVSYLKGRNVGDR